MKSKRKHRERITPRNYPVIGYSLENFSRKIIIIFEVFERGETFFNRYERDILVN